MICISENYWVVGSSYCSTSHSLMPGGSDSVISTDNWKARCFTRRKNNVCIILRMETPYLHSVKVSPVSLVLLSTHSLT